MFKNVFKKGILWLKLTKPQLIVITVFGLILTGGASYFVLGNKIQQKENVKVVV